MTPRRADERQALSDRVMTRVRSHGVSRRTVEEAVTRVLETLGTERTGSTEPPLLAAVTARSTPDLASRIRRDLGGAGIVIEEMGLGSAGQHTVVTLRVPTSARSELERLAERSRWSLSFLNPHDLGASIA